MIGILGADLAELHDIGTVDGEGILETVEVPVLEKGQVQADMGGGEPVIFFQLRKKCVEVADVVHGTE